jgi:hypothetical protein
MFSTWELEEEFREILEECSIDLDQILFELYKTPDLPKELRESIGNPKNYTETRAFLLNLLETNVKRDIKESNDNNYIEKDLQEETLETLSRAFKRIK